MQSMCTTECQHTITWAIYKWSITHIISINNTDLWGGQVNSKGLLPMWQKLQWVIKRIHVMCLIKSGLNLIQHHQTEICIIIPGGSHQGQSRQCWGQGCLCYPQQLPLGSPRTQNHLRNGQQEPIETKCKQLLFGVYTYCNLDLLILMVLSFCFIFNLNLGSFTWIRLLSKSNDMFTINVILLCKEQKTDWIHKCKLDADGISENQLLFWCSLFMEKMVQQPSLLFLPRSRTCCGAAASSGSVFKNRWIRFNTFAFHSGRLNIYLKRDSPVIGLDELHQLVLRVRFSRDDDWIVHEGFVEVDLIKLQLQSLGNLLQWKRPENHFCMCHYIKRT